MRRTIGATVVVVALAAVCGDAWFWRGSGPTVPPFSEEELQKCEKCDQMEKQNEEKAVEGASPEELREVAAKHEQQALEEKQRAEEMQHKAIEEEQAEKKKAEDAKKREEEEKQEAEELKRVEEEKKEQQEKAAQEKIAQEKIAQEKAAQEKAAQEKAAQEKIAQEKIAQEKAAQEKVAQEKVAQEKAGAAGVAHRSPQGWYGSGGAEGNKSAEQETKEKVEREKFQKGMEESQKREEENRRKELEKEKWRRENSNGAYLLTLKNIYLSHGDLSPPFSPDLFNYELNLQNPHDQLAITPEIYKDRPEYAGGETNMPLIEMLWDDGPSENAIVEPVAVAVRRQIDLRDDGGDMSINVRVVNPHDEHIYITYYILLRQSASKLTLLKGLEARDENGNIVEIDPLPSRDEVTYTAYVAPESRTLNIRPHCVSSWVTIDGQNVPNRQPYTLLRDLMRHVQIVQISCGRGSRRFWQEKDMSSSTYFLKIVSNYKKEEIAMPRMIVESVGKECRQSAEAYSCPDPKDNTHATQLLGIINPRIRYTIETPDGKVQIRVLNQIPTVPFSYRSDLYVKGVAGKHSDQWPLRFEVPLGGGFLAIIGMLLGFCLAVILATQVAVLALAGFWGTGLPVGITEIASILTLTLQYLCYSNTLLDGGMFDSTTKALRWVTLFVPLPWESGRHTVGDVQDIANAYGCLFWCMIILLTTILMHSLAAAKVVLLERNCTFPHSLRFGGVECRVINWLVFPFTTAAAICLLDPDAPTGWKVCSVAALVLTCVWALMSWSLVRRLVRNHDAVWVWCASTRAEGDLNNTSGYWSDVLCDQLNTQPATASSFPCIDWQWSSTVADIEPVNIAPEIFSRRSEYVESDYSSSARQSLKSSSYVSGSMSNTMGEGAFFEGYPMGKSPKPVEVIRARAPAKWCPGQRLMVGLLRTQWLDMILTYRSLTLLHDQFLKNASDDTIIPLVSKTNQLQGPQTAGTYSFFFDGARIPFVKICDSIARLFLGICIGIAITTTNSSLAAAMFCIIAIVTIAILVYFVCTCPYSRPMENCLYASAMIAVSVTSLMFMGASASAKQPSGLADTFLCFTVLVALAMGVYSIFISLSLCSSMICPPLPESRFIESLSNCTVSIADHPLGLAVEVPGWTKYKPKHVKIYSSHTPKGPSNVSLFATGEEPPLEFHFDDIRTACRTGSIRTPVICLYAPSTSPLQYNHLNIYDKSRCQRAIMELLSSEHVTRGVAGEVAKSIMRQVDVLGSKSILVATVLNPKNADHRSVSGSTTSRKTASTESGYDWSSSSGSRDSPSSSSSSKTSSSQSTSLHTANHSDATSSDTARHRKV